MKRSISITFLFFLCFLFSSCNSQDSIAANFSNYEKFKNINNIKIDTGPGNITIEPSNDDETTIEFAAEEKERNEMMIDLFKNVLSVKRNHNPEGKIFVSAKPVHMTIRVASSVNDFWCHMGKGYFFMKNFNGNVFLHTGVGNISFADICGNISVKTGPLNGGIFSGIKGKVDIKSSVFNISLLNVFGDIFLKGSGNVDYTMLEKPNFGINIEFDGHKIYFTMNLCAAFKSISNNIKKFSNIHTALPLVDSGGDISFLGKNSGGNVIVNQIN